MELIEPTKNDKFLLSQPKTTDHNPVDITEYLI